MEYALLTLALLMTTGDARPDGDRVTVRGMNQRLQLTGWQATWEAKAEIQPPVHPVPGGRMIALLKQGDGKRDIVLWSKEGHELASTALALAGEVMASRVFDKRLVLTTTSEVGEFDIANLHPGRVRKFVVPAGKDTKYLPGPTGVWVVNDQALSYHDLDGRPPLQRKRPLAQPTNKPPCADVFPNITAPCSDGFQPKDAEMTVSDAGELLMLDVFKELYPIKPSGWRLVDEVWPSITTVFDTNGSVVTQKVTSWMQKKREWFWALPSTPNDPTGSAADWGLVRTRYTTRGIGPGRLFGSRGNDFLFWSSGDRMTIHRWSRQIAPLWKERIQDLAGGFIVSPSWATSMLLHDHGCYKFSMLSGQGHRQIENVVLIEAIDREQEMTHFKRPRFAIGQSTEGDWLLIAY